MLLWCEILLTIACILLSGTFAGLTLGLMSLDLTDLRVISESGTDTEKWYALRILPIRRRGNWLLCTLLICNTAINAAFAIFTAGLFGGLGGFLASTFLILYIGEIIPQAICHRYGLVIGAYMVPLVTCFMYLTAPLSLVTAKVLDCCLGGDGEHATRYNRSQLKSLLNMHAVSANKPETDNDSQQSLDDPSQQAMSFRVAHSIKTKTSEHDNNNRGEHSQFNDPMVELSQETANHNNMDSSSSHIHLDIDCSPVNSSASTSPAALKPSTDQEQRNVKRNDENNSVLDCSSSIPKAPDALDDSPKRNKNSFNPFSRFLPSNRKSNSMFSIKRKEKEGNLSNSSKDPPPLTIAELAMLGGAFDFSQKRVDQVMTPLGDVFMLDESLSLNFKILLMVCQSGHSRIPIYSESRQNIIGLLFAKDLILLDPEDSIPIKTVLSFFNRSVFSVLHDTRLDKMLNLFCQGSGHIAIVRKTHQYNHIPSKVQQQCFETTGIVTLEDLMEELIGQDIVDETDAYKNNLGQKCVKRVRSIHPDNLQMLVTHKEKILSGKEVSAVASYLSTNVKEFSSTVVRLDVLTEMLAKNPIIECHGAVSVSSPQIESIDSQDNNDIDTASGSSLQSSPSDNRNGTVNDSKDISATNTTHIEHRGVNAEAASHFVTDQITHGDSMIYSKGVPAKNAYLVLQGKLEVISGEDGFISQAGPWALLGPRALTQDLYAPDFSAKVVERPTKLLRISRKLYRLMIHGSYMNNSVKSGDVTATSVKREAIINHDS